MLNIYAFHKKNFIIFTTIIFLFSSTYLANVENDVNAKIKKCTACHTLTGNSITPTWPKIAEQHSEYLYKQLIEYKKGKDGNRFDPTMLGMLQGVNEEDMKEMSDYFSKQIIEKSKNKTTENKIKDGKTLYLYGDKNNNVIACVGCHGIDGTGNKLAGFPSLKWQHKDYIVTQLKKFKNSDRSNDANSIMRDISANMSNDQMDVLADYISCIE